MRPESSDALIAAVMTIKMPFWIGLISTLRGLGGVERTAGWYCAGRNGIVGASGIRCRQADWPGRGPCIAVMCLHGWHGNLDVCPIEIEGTDTRALYLGDTLAVIKISGHYQGYATTSPTPRIEGSSTQRPARISSIWGPCRRKNKK